MDLGQLQRMATAGSVEDRFWSKVKAMPSGCWEWQGSLNGRGYGQFTWAARAGRTRPINTHRVAWELLHGPILHDLHVLHRCDNRKCVNAAEHLFLGTHTDNMRDAAAKGRLSVPRPRRQTVSDEQLAEMLSLRRAGMTLQSIADRFGVTKTYVCLLVKGKRRQYSDLSTVNKAEVA